jgi:hypothetical protein
MYMQYFSTTGISSKKWVNGAKKWVNGAKKFVLLIVPVWLSMYILPYT